MNPYHNVVSRLVVVKFGKVPSENAEGFLIAFARTSAGRMAHGISICVSVGAIILIALAMPSLLGNISTGGTWELSVALPASLLVVAIVSSTTYGLIAATLKRHSR